MTARWAVRLDGDDRALASRLRLEREIEVCAVDESLWLRGPLANEPLERKVRLLPGGERYAVLDDGQLIPSGGCVPTAYLPRDGWRPIHEWLKPALPVAALASRERPAVRLELVRDAAEREPTMLLTSLSAWVEYASTAPQVRLDRWSFAAAADGRILIRGQPLPPLPGTRYVELAGVAVPAGWHWWPAVDPESLRGLLRLSDQDMALLGFEGDYERVATGDFVRATRSAARKTAEGAAP